MGISRQDSSTISGQSRSQLEARAEAETQRQGRCLPEELRPYKCCPPELQQSLLSWRWGERENFVDRNSSEGSRPGAGCVQPKGPQKSRRKNERSLKLSCMV